MEEQADRACGTGISKQSFRYFFVLLVLVIICRLQSNRLRSHAVGNSSASCNKNNGGNGGMAERMAEWQKLPHTYYLWYMPMTPTMTIFNLLYYLTHTKHNIILMNSKFMMNCGLWRLPSYHDLHGERMAEWQK